MLNLAAGITIYINFCLSTTLLISSFTDYYPAVNTVADGLRPVSQKAEIEKKIALPLRYATAATASGEASLTK